MSDSEFPVALSPADAATRCARELRAGPVPSVRDAARRIGDAVWTAADPSAAAALRAVDADFATRVGPFEGPDAGRHPRARTVTPWLDAVGAAAIGWGMSEALGMGRYAGRWRPRWDPVDAETVIVCAALAIALHAVGALFAHRERTVLRGQRANSVSAQRASLVLVSAAFGALTIAGMIWRLAGHPLPSSFVALFWAIALVIVTVPLGVWAVREANAGVAKGMLYPQRPARIEVLSASEDACAEATDAVANIDARTREQVDAAYRAGVTLLIAGGGLPKTTVDRLRKADGFAARYNV